MDFTQRTAQENVWTSFGNTAATSLITISVKTSYEITSRNVASVRRSVGRNSRNFSVRPGSLPACNSPATAGGTGTKNEVHSDLLLKSLDVFFHATHILIISFTLVGWAFQK